MMFEVSNCSYFLAANSGEGFVSLFTELYDPRDGWKLYIIKGGPGTGKSGLMRKICKKAEELGYSHDKILCSSDPASLDAVIIYELKTAVCDGTSPHIMEPLYPGVSETIVNLGECWDEISLKNDAQHILTLTDCNKELHKKSARYLAAAASAAKNNDKIFSACTDFQKIDNFVIRALYKFTSSDRVTKPRQIFLNGNTPDGKTVMFESALAMCKNIVSISDEYCCISPDVIGKLATFAQTKGLNTVIALDPLIPSSPLHLILPDEKTGFFTSCSGYNFKAYANKNINATRFIDKDKFSVYKNKVAFNKKVSDSFLDEAINVMQKAKTVHDELEKYYIKAMHFEKLDSKTDKLIKKIFSC